MSGMQKACERQIIAGQDGADILLRRDKEIFRAQLVHNDSFGCRPIDSIYNRRYVPVWLALGKDPLTMAIFCAIVSYMSN